MADTILPIIDYTSRDYQAIRSDLIKMARARIPGWTGEDNNDFGLALIEAFAYGIDGIHYYLDRTMNEAYLSTAVQRESLYSIASMFHYQPRPPQAATIELIFMNSTLTKVLVPAGTRCQASVPGDTGATVKMFETVEEVWLPEKTTAAPAESQHPVSAIEGQTYPDQAVGTSNGYANQRYILGHNSILPDTTTMKTVLQETVSDWTEVPDLATALPTDNVFQIERQVDGSSVVLFGNGLNGRVPELHSVIQATYRVGGGTDGNVPPGSVDTIVAPTLTGVSVKNELAATGGLNAESLESIRINAAKSFRSRDRCVTLTDYESVAESINTVAKSKAIGNSGSSVTVYIVPNNDGSGKPELGDLAFAIKDELMYKSMAGVSVSVYPASWVDIYLGIRVFCSPTAYQIDVNQAVRQRLAAFYGFDYVDFNGRVAASDISALLANVYGVEYIEVTRITEDPPVDGVFEDFVPSPGKTPIDTILFSSNDIPYYYDTFDVVLAGEELPHIVIEMVGGIEAVG